MSDLGTNKIAGAVLATGLAILGLGAVSDMVFAVEAPEKPGYAVEVQIEEEAGAPVAETPPDWGTVLPTADVAAGQTAFAKCTSCHTFNAGGANLTGPNLYGVVGRKPGAHAGFPYSQAMIDFGNENGSWDFQRLYDFLHAPQQDVKGTKMTFVGLKRREEKINMIAFLRTQSASPASIPAPNPAAAAVAAGPEGSASAPGGETVTAGAATSATAAPTAAPTGAPVNNVTANPTGQTPATGAAQAPSQVVVPKGNPGL